ncbi:hypothetical protein F4778DRAFT_529300 [Xylariomycetidae sp. FL2044]|nr:hypothetical protein F4778DRAFT_529300 [Xylariomycetidae sp. FL2044]
MDWKERHTSEVCKKLGFPGVRLVHRSVVEFLESRYFKAKLDEVLPGFDPFDASSQTLLGQLKRVALPMIYFAPPRSDPERVWTRDRQTAVFIRIETSLSLKAELFDLLALDLPSPQKICSSRFSEFLTDVRWTIRALDLSTAVTDVALWIPYVTPSPLAVECSPEDVPILLLAIFGVFEQILHQRDISPKLINGCTVFCAQVCGKVCAVSHRVHAAEWSRLSTTLEILLSLGGSPDGEVHNDKPSPFHVFLFECFHYGPNLPSMAFMLYQAVNPRFRIRVDGKKYSIKRSYPRNKRRVFSKAFFQVASSPQGVSGEVSWRPFVLPKARSPFIDRDLKRGVGMVVEYGFITKRLQEGQITLDFKDLLRLWFPEHHVPLHQVVDWILALGTPVDSIHRQELQAKFGNVLRPMFDMNHPDFSYDFRDEVHLDVFTLIHDKYLQPITLESERIEKGKSRSIAEIPQLAV